MRASKLWDKILPSSLRPFDRSFRFVQYWTNVNTSLPKFHQKQMAQQINNYPWVTKFITEFMTSCFPDGEIESLISHHYFQLSRWCYPMIRVRPLASAVFYEHPVLRSPLQRRQWGLRPHLWQVEVLATWQQLDNWNAHPIIHYVRSLIWCFFYLGSGIRPLPAQS